VEIAGVRAPSVTSLTRGAPAFRSLQTEWRTLAEGSDPFVLPEWFALTAAFLREGEPFVLMVRRGADLTAALALHRHGRTFASLGSAHTPRYDLVGDASAIPQIWARLRAEPGWDRLVLECVPAGSPLVTRLPELARREGFLVAIRIGPRSPYLPLDGFEERLDGKFRRNLRARAKRLGDLSLERLTQFDEGAIREAFALEAMGWKGSQGTAVARDPRALRFYLSLARVFARRGALALTFLRARGKRIAFHYALEDTRTYRLLKTSFDPAYGELGPGQLLLREVARDAARRGLTELDFLGWEMDWKQKWTSRLRDHATVSLCRPTLAQRLSHTARHVLRPRAVETLRRAREWIGP
jgi:CelD/BcsL family acetyltransferase involved in cellulose biosynthesis